jgi:PE family
MSFVVAAPELVQAAAQDLASTRSTLDEAFASAAAPTTAVAAAAQDEVSTRVAALFGAFGQEYQALSARATAFHEQFVNTLNAGAGAYVSAEAANTGSIAGPYQTLLANTATNLQALRSVISANPAPFLRQFLSNQTVYAQTIAAEIETVIQNFPTVLANLPANIQAAIQAFLAFDPLPYLQHFVNNQMAYAGIVSMSLQNAANHFVAGLQALPAAFESAFQALQAGNISGAVNDITGGFVTLFITGFGTTSTGDVLVAPGLIASVFPTGTVGDLLPILTIPGMMAQNLTNLLPAGSIPAQISQNFTNVIDTVTDTSITADALITVKLLPPSIKASLTNTFGLPVALLFDALGGPANGLNGLVSSATTFADAVQTGNAAGAIGALVDAPAVVADDFLNGEETLPIGLDISGFPAVINLPLDGILVPTTPYTASISGLPLLGSITVTAGGTPLSGLVPALLNFLPEELAAAIAP